MLASIARNWWILLLRGICAVVFGILAFAWPGITLTALVFAFGIYAFADGVSAVGLGSAAGPDGRPWWQMIAVGIVSTIIGVATFVWPRMTALALLALIAVWAIVRGVVEITAAIRLRALLRDEWLLVLGGACSILFGLLVIARPAVGALAVLWIIGTYAIVFGSVMTALAFRLRSLSKGLSIHGAGTPAHN